MNIEILSQAERELRKAPKEVIMDAYSLFEDLENGKNLTMPISKPLPSIYKGLHELRLSYRDGIYRIFYIFKVKDTIYVLHAMKKKTQKIDKKTKDLLLKRIGSL
ncbi:MAG: type II toxin-antitoxin system RelE/ParE family toxin [Bdellovibrionales bacterium]|nr:type II toxin-antitoxin system RelE/ParE family toxin [Bdellovibrionales bacterium]MCB0413301.1 type II toxin-antitoxin system RelE/ParE family toxin [Bdellovibrionales bacterium]